MSGKQPSRPSAAAETDPGAADRIVARIAAEYHEASAQPLRPGLYVVATPIGNLGDITLRALSVLARCDVIYCEDTRHSRTLFSHYGLRPAVLRAYHEHNAEAGRREILAALARGARVALVSDAGTPLVSDPGYKIVRDASAAGHRVEALPGPSAMTSALVVAGLPTDTVLFAGFLPVRDGARWTRLAELATAPATLIFFEAPSRLLDTLDAIGSVLTGRPVVVCRELTKLHEEIVRGTPEEIARHFSEASPRGEVVILVAPPAPTVIDDDTIRSRLEEALSRMSVKDAVAMVAATCGVAKRHVYEIALSLRDDAT